MKYFTACSNCAVAAQAQPSAYRPVRTSISSPYSAQPSTRDAVAMLTPDLVRQVVGDGDLQEVSRDALGTEDRPWIFDGSGATIANVHANAASTVDK